MGKRKGIKVVDRSRRQLSEKEQDFGKFMNRIADRLNAGAAMRMAISEEVLNLDLLTCFEYICMVRGDDASEIIIDASEGNIELGAIVALTLCNIVNDLFRRQAEGTLDQLHGGKRS